MCPQEKQCEGSCFWAARANRWPSVCLERYVADAALAGACESLAPESADCARPRPDLKVACLGSGPSSLTCAGYLAGQGIKVTVFEGLHEPGGVLVYGIPAFRLPKDVVRRELDKLRALDVDIRTNWVGGRTVTIDSLFAEGYQAVFGGRGRGPAPVPQRSGRKHHRGVFGQRIPHPRQPGPGLRVPGLRHAHLPRQARYGVRSGERGYDAARTAARLGAESVHIVYRARQGGNAPPAGRKSNTRWKRACSLSNWRRLCALWPETTSGWRAWSCSAWNWANPTPRAVAAAPSARRYLHAGNRSGHCGPGHPANPLLLEATPRLALNKKGYIMVDEATGETSIPNVFAGATS